MPRFEYIALDAKGVESRGVVDASNQNDVVSQLRSSGYFPTSVVPEGQGPKPAKGAKAKTARAITPAGAKKGGGVVLFKRKTVKSKVLMIFTRQLATLIDAGLPLLKGLAVLAKQEKDLVLRDAINSMSDAVQGGSTFSESMGQHPKIFNRLYVSMVKAGEIGGVLELVLQRLAEFQEKAQKIRNKIKSAMTYPMVVMFIALVILFFLMTTIVPKFQQIFNDMLNGTPLPGLTLWVMNLSQFVQNMWVPPNLFITLGIIFALGLGWWSLNNTEKGKNGFDRFKLRMPVFGDILRKGAIARFSRTLGTLVTSGVPILQALNITKETAGNVVLADAISKVHDAVKEGESIVAPLEASGVFPPMVISMVDVGEETGQLPDMLLKVAEVYDDEVDNAVESLTSLLEPIMIVFLAVIVGTIVIALFLPLIEIIKKMQGGAGGG